MPNCCSRLTTYGYDTSGRIHPPACDTSQLGAGALFLLISPDTTWPALHHHTRRKKGLKQITEGGGAMTTFGTALAWHISSNCMSLGFSMTTTLALSIGVPFCPFAGRHTVLTLFRFGRRIKSDATKNLQGVRISDWPAQPQVIHFVPLVVHHAHPTIADRRL